LQLIADDQFVVRRPILTPHAAHLPDRKLLTFCSLHRSGWRLRLLRRSV